MNENKCITNSFRFRRGALLLFLFAFLHLQTSYGQNVNSLDNQIGMWHHRSSWSANWPGINNPGAVSGKTVEIKGYLTNGFLSISSSISLLDGSAKLYIYDTLRIHGSLTLEKSAMLNIAPGGVLIIHGDYVQKEQVTFQNQGKMIVFGNWTATAPAFSFSNTGSIYVQGTTTSGGNSFTTKSHTDLVNESPVLAYFSNTNVITAHCEGSNSGSLSINSSYTVSHWEYSDDFFVNHIVIIPGSNTTSISYTNLLKTRSYRCYYKESATTYQYSKGATIVIIKPTLGGTITGTEEVCTGTNSVSLQLTGYRGKIIRWEYSTDGFNTDIQYFPTNTEELMASDLTKTTAFRVLVQNGPCESVYSPVHTVTVSPVSVGGEISGSTSVCKTGNSGALSLQNNVGGVVRWEMASDNLFTNPIAINNTTNDYFYQDLQTTTYFRTVVKSGSCTEAYSTAAKVEVQEVAGGTLAGSTTVCTGTNTGRLTLEGAVGTIVRWEKSTDNFVANIEPVANTTTEYNFQDLAQTTYYRVVVGSTACQEKFSTIAVVEVESVAGGDLLGSSVVCIGNNSGTLSLSGHSGNVVRWEQSTDNFNLNVTPIANTTTQQEYRDLAQTTYYRVVIGGVVCPETFSTVATVEVTRITGGSLSGSDTVCEGQNSGTLTLSGYEGQIIQWEESKDNFNTDIRVIQHTLPDYTYTNLTQTTYYRAVVGNGVCEPVRSTVATVETVPLNTGSISGTTSMCSGESAVLTLSNYQGSIVRWEKSTDGFASSEIIPNSAREVVELLLTETTSFKAVVGNGFCAEAYTDMYTVDVTPLANGGVVAGSAVVVKGEQPVKLQLQENVGSIIGWESSTDNFTNEIIFYDSLKATFSMPYLIEPTYFRVKVKSGECLPVVYSKPFLVKVNTSPVVEADTFYINQFGVFYSSYSVLDNDMDPEGFPLVVSEVIEAATALRGSISINVTGYVSYVPETYLTKGIEVFVYQVCDKASDASLCKSTSIVLIIDIEKPAILAYEGISPNGDGKNDEWIIENIRYYKDNLVRLFDHNGTLVYEEVNYDNNQRRFDGVGNKGARTKNMALPDGTYYYKIMLGNEFPVESGYLIINR